MAKKPTPEAPPKAAVAKVEPSAVSTECVDLYEETAGEGAEEVTGADLAVPFLNITQALSPQRDKNKSEFIPGASEGDVFNSVTSELWGDPGVEVIPVVYHPRLIEWRPRDQGGGFVASHERNQALLDSAPRDSENRRYLPNGNILAETGEMYCLIVREDGQLEPVVVSMSSTNLTPLRKWITVLTQQKFFSERDKKYKAKPFFANVYRMATVAKSNDQGSWYAWQVPIGVRPTNLPELTEARAFHGLVQSGAVKAQVPTQDSPQGRREERPLPPADDDIPI